MLRKFSIFSALALLSLICTMPGYGTDVSGPQSGTWMQANSPYHVVGEVNVPSDSMLIIEPGVDVIFDGFFKLVVNSGATLRAVGLIDDSIQFRPANPAVGWHGIRFLNGSDNSKLRNCRITRGRASGVGPDEYGGGIYITDCAPTLENCLIDSCTADGGGGGISSSGNPAIVQYCLIRGNEAGFGGGLRCSGAIVRHNWIEGNHATGGGGISCSNYNTIIEDNVIYDNSASYGGGIQLNAANGVTIRNNLIINNGGSYGGGIEIQTIGTQNVLLQKNTIASNDSWPSSGGAIYSYIGASGAINISDCIIWSNGTQPIYPPTSSCYYLAYSDLQGGWSGPGGQGVVDADPRFVNVNEQDYRIQWRSPCIDTGDPSAPNNDPDGTRADMGAFFFNQTHIVPVWLTPYDMPIQLPAAGGSFDFAIRVTNIDISTHVVTVWCDEQFPDGSFSEPVLGPTQVILIANQTISKVRTQMVPSTAPGGVYHYFANAAAAGDTSRDQFGFYKIGAAHGFGDLAGWTNSGEAFLEETHIVASESPSQFALRGAYPNPFNASTVLSYQLPVTSYVRLEVFDIAGRLVGARHASPLPLVDGYRSAGTHELTFDASDLSSGMYVYRIQAGNWTESGKMVLLK